MITCPTVNHLTNGFARAYKAPYFSALLSHKHVVAYESAIKMAPQAPHENPDLKRTKSHGSHGNGLFARIGSGLKHAFSSHSDEPSSAKKSPTASSSPKLGGKNPQLTREKSVHHKLAKLETHVFHGILPKDKRVEDIYELGEEIGKGG